MSIKGNLYMMLAMAGIFGGMEHLPQSLRSKPRVPDKPLTPEEIAELIAERKEKFRIDMANYHERVFKEFPNWKNYEVNGYTIYASNLKNAIKQFNYLLKSNYLLLEYLEVPF